MSLISILQTLAALAFVLALMALCVFGLKRFSFASSFKPASQRRLSVVETLPLDHRRKLALIRQDGKEHLVLLGAQQDLLLSSQDAVETTEIRKI